ncbi:MAG: Y4bD/Y4pK family protein [Fischerella sp. CENA71]|nr:Y4bD/Y4pK family protein [Fischerella sp. CENA71]
MLYRRWWGQYNKTAHNFKSLLGSYVIITNPIHPLYGQSVVIRLIRKVGQEIKVTVESPLGGCLSLPATETDLWTQQASKTKTVGKFLPQKLLRLSEWVAYRSQFVTSSISCVPDNKEIEHREDSYETQASTNRRTRKLRKAKSSNKANSTVSRQDTHNTRFRRGARQE